MIARQVMGAFADVLDRLNEASPSDTINLAPVPYDEASEDDPTFTYLSDAALPSDPSAAAIIGIIDDVMPFAHERLRVGTTASRVASIWLQDVPPDLTTPVGGDLPFGRELRGGHISALLAELGSASLRTEEALYRRTSSIDFRRPLPQRLAMAATHGSAVSGQAAGVPSTETDLGRSLPLIAVCLPTSVSRDTLGTTSPFYITLGILHIIHRARRLCRTIERRKGLASGSVRLPVVINISYGLTAGPKDGSSLLERFMDAISAAAEQDLGPVRFVLPMGNHRQSRLHATVDANAATPLDWEVKPNDQTPSFVEIWGPRRRSTTRPIAPVQIECTPPGAQPVTTTFAAPGTYQILTEGGKEVARAYYQQSTTAGYTREAVTLVIPPTQPEQLGQPYGQPGRWKLRILSARAGAFEVYVQRDDTLKGFGIRRGRQSHLVDDGDPAFGPDGRIVETDPRGKTRGVLRRGSVNAFATGDHPIAVGGSYAHGGGVTPYSGLDFGRGGSRQKGDMLAPSDQSPNQQGLSCLGTWSGSRTQVSGTSLSAPQVARELALAFVAGTVAEDQDRSAVVAVLRGS
jgi:hypothetical protein